MMKLATRSEGTLIYKAIKYKREKNIGLYNGLVEAIASDLKTSKANVIKLINNIERRM